ncbi:high affinity choline transporter 1-like [Gigantopelta aegis]|uniref:high affinity choline transporter 1-like n=1 Tax=Gigantopelta aegis TaxID=1735272 RepID=UPI001B88B9BB|nr:high affinity choline transporter 1-like [Gigantopelta aegis]
MAANIAGIVVLAVFYLLIFLVGMVAARKVKVKGQREGHIDASFVAGRDLNTVVGIFTMIATTVGGGYINGTAESIVSQGLVWTLAPLGIFFGLSIGGLVYARRMRDEQYVTLLDPIQEQYGSFAVGLVYMASLCGDIFWTASILSALGTSLSVVINVDLTIAIWASSAVTVIYTTIGQIVAVAYTDVAQLVLITFGLTLSVPFVLTNERVGNIGANSTVWIGSIDKEFAGLWADLLIAMTFGTIPWQAYFQRVLSVKSGKQAQILSIVGACGAVVLVIPSILIGAAAVSADWSGTKLEASSMDSRTSSMILPLVLHEFTPTAVAILGLGALSAAVMSSMDSSILGSSTMFTHNIYNNVIRKQASNWELLLVQRFTIVVLGLLSTVISLHVPIIYGLFILAADIVFVIVLPQLTCSLFLKRTNGYGSVAGFLVGTLLRLGAGEFSFSFEPFIFYPFYDDKLGQLFPFRTFSMLCSCLTIMFVSELARYLFEGKVIPSGCDVLQAFKRAERYFVRTVSVTEESKMHIEESEMKSYTNVS